MNPSISAAAGEAFVEAMAASMRALAEQLVEGLRAGEATLEVLEQEALQSAKRLGNVVLSGLCSLCESRSPAPEVRCACGAQARYQRWRTVPTKTLLDTIEVRRAYYLCPPCHQGVAPLDQRLGLCPGGLSAGLEEMLALLGVTQDSFEQAVAVLEKLSLVRVCPNSARAATETLGAVVVAAEEAQAAAAWAPDPSLAPAPREAPERLSVSIDGAMVNTREAGWKETRLGACDTTVKRPTSKRPAGVTLHAQALSFVADLSPAEPFGCLLWLEASRRGVTQAKEVVVIGDGADWIWRLAEDHFPGATQIVDWYHASQSRWAAAHAIYADSDLATRWAHRALDALWEGRLATVLANLDKHAASGEPVQRAISYITNNQHRMHYDRYRAAGLQIGSGSIESGCKQVIGQRLKLAGMRCPLQGIPRRADRAWGHPAGWNRQPARAVVMLRARLKSGRWDETLALRPPPRRAPRQPALAA